MVDLKSCPFCGGEAEMDTRQGYLALGTGRPGNRIAVYCQYCDADMGVCIEDVPDITPEQVAEMWNRRAAVEADRAQRVVKESLTTVRHPDIHDNNSVQAKPADYAGDADKMVPSDAEIVAHLRDAGVIQDDLVITSHEMNMARIVIARWGQPAASAERELRRLLAYQYAGVALYRDDGELQDNSAAPFIDFLRDSPEQISEKMTKRGVAQIAASAEPVAWMSRVELDRFAKHRAANLSAAGCAVAMGDSINNCVPLYAAPIVPVAQEHTDSKELKDALNSLSFYKHRCELLQKWQHKMRDPERTLVCDVLANGQLLQDSSGNPDAGRYSIPVAQEPVATLHDDGHYTFKRQPAPQGSDHAGWRMDVFAAPVAAQTQEPVAYLDVGAGGYLDLGAHKKEEELLALPPGRHMLGIIGTYGADGYTVAPVAAQRSVLDPREVDLADPVFEAIWQVIKRWDLSRDNNGIYSGATGTDVMSILSPVRVALLTWAVEQWYAQVRARPLSNIHRRSLDDVWRQVIRRFGGDEIALVGRRHDDRVAAAPVAAQSNVPRNQIESALNVVQDAMQDAYSNGHQECCGHGIGGECCGNADVAWNEADRKVMDVLAPVQRALSVILVTAQGREDALTPAARDVLAERQRQIDVEGWTPEHDDEHSNGELAHAAAAYALNAGNVAPGWPHDPRRAFCEPPEFWPWDREWWKPDTLRWMLVKAGALILAEIERLDRAARKEQP